MQTVSEAPPKPPWVFVPELPAAEFDLFRELIARRCGIKLSDAKRLLLQNRIGKRLRALGMADFAEYYRYVTSRAGKRDELRHLWSAITTNETHFFREPHHFETLRKDLLPALASRRSTMRTLRFWSAGCSTGQEVYSLAMALEDWTADHSGWHYTIIGTDIDDNVLKVAAAGVYPREQEREIPPQARLRYVDCPGRNITMRPRLRAHTRFVNANFATVRPLRPKVDVIFCRNAIMYLNMPTRARLARVFWESLTDGGYLLVGSSESLHGLPVIFDNKRLGRTLAYQRAPRQEASDGGR